MAADTFARTLTVTTDRAQAWDVLTDVDRLAGWVTIVHDVQELARLEKYTAVLQDRVGPFKMRADLDITADVVEPGRRIDISASGRDRALDTRIAVKATMVLSDIAAGGTSIEISGDYQVTGKAAGMGAGVIRKKADGIINDFFASAARELGGV
jgi:carbon monoxide dehydrogenase subunit G